MMQKKPKLPNGGKSKQSNKKAVAATGIVTAVFAVLGIVFAIIGWHNEILHWMQSTGIAFLILALVPLTYVIYNLIKRKLES